MLTQAKDLEERLNPAPKTRKIKQHFYEWNAPCIAIKIFTQFQIKCKMKCILMLA